MEKRRKLPVNRKHLNLPESDLGPSIPVDILFVLKIRGLVLVHIGPVADTILKPLLGHPWRDVANPD